MNVVREIERINEQELQHGVSGTKASWHYKYRASAWVYVGGLPYELTEGDVICVMSQWGEVEDFNMPREEKTGKSRGWAWVKVSLHPRVSARARSRRRHRATSVERGGSAPFGDPSRRRIAARSLAAPSHSRRSRRADDPTPPPCANARARVPSPLPPAAADACLVSRETTFLRAALCVDSTRTSARPSSRSTTSTAPRCWAARCASTTARSISCPRRRVCSSAFPPLLLLLLLLLSLSCSPVFFRKRRARSSVRAVLFRLFRLSSSSLRSQARAPFHRSQGSAPFQCATATMPPAWRAANNKTCVIPAEVLEREEAEEEKQKEILAKVRRGRLSLVLWLQSTAISRRRRLAPFFMPPSPLRLVMME